MKNLARYLFYLKIGAVIAAVVVVAVLAWWLVRGIKSSSLSFEKNELIDLTPQQIEAIKSIGEWEFLSVSDEVLVDTVRKGFFSDDHLARIYYGTLRLGVNFKQLKDNWIEAKGDSVSLSLPPVYLLDSDFIDEARTRSFYESGKWSQSDREDMYKRAAAQMRQHALTASNIESAKMNGERQIRAMMQSFGFKHIGIQFEDDAISGSNNTK